MVYPQPLVHLILVSAGILGAIVGSFLNVCIYRLPKEYLSIVYPCSHCTFCGKAIRWFDNIPVLSWLLLGGACRYCRSPIRLRYPFVELLTAVGFVMCVHFVLLSPPLFKHFDENQDGRITAEEVYTLPLDQMLDLELRPVSRTNSRGWVWPRELDSDNDRTVTRQEWQKCPLLPTFAALSLEERWPALFLALYFVGILIVITFIDIDFRIIPNSLNFPGLLIAPIFSALCPIMLRPLPFIEEPHISGFIASLLGIVVGGGTLYLVGIVGKVLFQKDAMGFGDIKMMAMVGGFLGWDSALLIFLLACVVGTVLGVLWLVITRDHYIPFGPYLALGTFITILFKKKIIYLTLTMWPNTLIQWVQPSGLGF